MINKKTFSYEVYQTLREELSICCRYFFDELYQIFSYNGEKLRTSEVFNTTYDEKEKKIRYNIYLKSEEFYNTCAKLLKNKSYQFFLTDFRNLHSLPSITTYDYILFSNISDYLSEWYPGAKPIERFAQDLANLSTKSDATLLMFAYIYDISSKKTRSPIDTLDGQNYLLSILSATSYDFPSALAPTTKDRILYQEKKKSLMEDSECYTSKSNVYEIFSQAEDYPKKILQEVVPLITGKIVLDI
jgi:hypothetical protein